MIDQRYDQTLARCDKALARQAAIMQRLSPNTAAYLHAANTMTALRNTKTIFIISHQRRVAAEIRQLRLDVLMQYRLRGQIIARAVQSVELDDILECLEEHGHDLDELRQCLELYHNWEDFYKATRWNMAVGKLPPDSLDDALLMLREWKGRRPH